MCDPKMGHTLLFLHYYYYYYYYYGREEVEIVCKNLPSLLLFKGEGDSPFWEIDSYIYERINVCLSVCLSVYQTFLHGI